MILKTPYEVINSVLNNPQDSREIVKALCKELEKNKYALTFEHKTLTFREVL